MKFKHINENIDELIDGFLKTDSVGTKANFAEAVIGAAKAADARDGKLDIEIDSLLSRLRDFRCAGFADRVIERAKISAPHFAERFFACAAALVVAACSAVAVFSSAVNATLPKGIPTKADYVQMNEISNEITDLKVLVAQEEFLDIMKM